MKIIYNKISSIINSMLEKVGYFFVGYKVDILNNGYSIKALQKFTRFNVDDIKAIQLTIKSMREDYESFKNKHNKLSRSYVDSKELLNNLNTRINALEIANELNKVDKEVYSEKFNLGEALKDELTKPSLNVDDNILMLENIINTITEAKVNNACKVVTYGEDIGQDKVPYLSKYSMKEILSHYMIQSKDDYKKYLMKLDEIATLKSKIENLNSICKVSEKLISDNDNKIASLERVNKEYERLLTSDNNYILEEIAKILVAYKGDLIIDDFIDDVNDKFNEFNNIYNDACDDDNIKTHYNAGINLSNERRENNAK